MTLSNCCSAPLDSFDVCSDCKEHSAPMETINMEITYDTSFGEAMDIFIAKYIGEEQKRIAMLDLQLIVVKAQRFSMQEIAKIYDPVAA